jgi:hypothetical protein
VSKEWAHAIGAASNRSWSNAAKVAAAMAAQHPDACYVEGWASMGAVNQPVWHAWVDVPLDRARRSWMRVDATPMWRWMMRDSAYAAVLGVTASEMARFVDPARGRGQRPRCRLPLVPLLPDPTKSYRQPMPADPLHSEFGEEAAIRSAEARTTLEAQRRAHSTHVHADVASELDRLAALRVLPPEP